nr:uncharacterized protein LOC111995693 [Quercus suber]
MFFVGLNKKFKYMKSDPERLVVTCVEDACPWSVRAINSKRRKLWEITTCKGPHTCSSLQVDHDGRMMDSKFIAITLESYVREDISRTIATLRSLSHAKHDHWASHYKVWDAKHKAVAAIYGDFDESYAELPRFLAALKDADPTTVTQLKCDNRNVLGTCTFNCALWAFGPCIEGFKHCRPVISIDATHLYGNYKGKLLIAMATDANNEAYPLAFAIVESESKETWGWFLAWLTNITDRSNLCIISDRHSGIKACFDDTSMTWLQSPKVHHRYCLRHVVSNVNTKWKISELKNLVWRAASANQVRKFEATLELIRNVKPAAHRYLEAENKQKWTLAHDEGRRYGAMTTNLSECFNGVLKGARSLPITAMVRFTFFKVNSYFDARRNLTLDQLEAGQKWCKYAMDKFEKNQAKAKDHMVTRMSAQARLYQVDTPGNPLTDGGGQHTHRVDLQSMTCTCGKWEALKIPCSHVIAICAKHKHDAQQFIDPCYSVTHRYHTYESIVVMAPKKSKNIKTKAKKVSASSSEPAIAFDQIRHRTPLLADVHVEESPIDPTAAVADNGDDEPTIPPPLSLRAMMETFMTTQAAHGQLLDGLIAEVAALRAKFSEYRSAFPPPPPSKS